MELVVIEHQALFLNLLRRVGHITLMGFLHTNDEADIATLDEDFLELTTSFLVLQTVDGEDLLDICLGQCQRIGNGRKLLFELTLVKENKHTGVADDGILDNLIACDVLNILSDHTDS